MDRVHSSRRRSRIVDASAQGRVVWGITVLPLAVLVVAAAVMWFLSDRLFDEAQAAEVELRWLGLLTMTQFVFVVMVGAVVVLRALEYSHRVVGPIYRITLALRRARAGNPEPIRLRKGDELVPIADEWNLLVEELARVPDASARPAAAIDAQPDLVALDSHDGLDDAR